MLNVDLNVASLNISYWKLTLGIMELADIIRVIVVAKTNFLVLFGWKV